MNGRGQEQNAVVGVIVKPLHLKGKLCPPRHGRAFDRLRLFQLLDEMSGMAGLWIYGPPGIGKTTLVTTYLDARSSRCLWLQLDAGDSDPAVFLQLLNLVISDAVSAQDESSAVPADDDLCDVPQLFERRFQRLADAHAPPWVLVLDNLQLLGDASSLHVALAAVLDSLPAGMQIICISRDPAPSVFGVAIARQQLGIVDSDKLRFNVPETGELVALHCPDSPVAELHRLADGWPAPMILILAAGGLARAGSFADNTRVRQYLFALFAGEVLDRMSIEDARTLEHIAWLPHATESMAIAVSGNSRAGDLLASLTQRSLFTYRQNQAQPVYSFHALFADFLRHRLETRISPAALHEQRMMVTLSGVGLGISIDLATYEFQRGLQLQLSGDRVSAARFMRQSLVSGRRCGWPLREHIALLGCTLTATEVGQLDEANRLMDEVTSHPFYAVCRWHQWIAAMIEANLADRQADLPRCLAALRLACDLCADYGFDSGPLLYSCADMMPRLCAVALSHDIGTEQVTGIIRRHGLPAPDQATENWPWPVRIFTLGRFALEFEDQRGLSSRKESRKALDLLKLLVTLGRGKKVSTDRLIRLLWPDADAVAARHSFENTLSRLRRIVGEKQLQIRSGTLSLNSAHCWSDLDTLELTLNTALPADGDNAVLLLELTVNLYGGPFLPGEDRYASVVLMRDRLQSRFLRRMEALGGVLEAEGRYDTCVSLYHRVLEQNPLAENIYRRLIACLLQLDCPAEALEVYRRCRQQLSVVLGIQPSPATCALVSELRRKSSAAGNR